MTTPEFTLDARNLSRHLGGRAIVHQASLQLRRGEVLGLLGHNGAGKSTTLQMLTGCLLPDHTGSGDAPSIDICGIDLLQRPVQAKVHLGYLPENPPLYRELSVDRYLVFVASLRGMPPAAVAEALVLAKQRCGLEAVGTKTIGTLSKGYQQRVGIAQAIIHRPALIVLDEPTVGLDPAQIRGIRSLIRELGDAHSVILSTHLLGEVESVCDRVEIMQHGKLIYSDTSVHMRQHGSVSGFIVGLDNPPPLEVLQGLAGVSHVEPLSATQFRVLHAPDSDAKSALLTLAEQQGWRLQQLTPLQATLEEIFVRLTGNAEPPSVPPSLPPFLPETPGQLLAAAKLPVPSEPLAATEARVVPAKAARHGGIMLLARRELRSLFATPSSWFVLAALQFVFAWFFLGRLDAFLEVQPQLAQLANPPGVTATVAAPMFNTIALLLMMLAPLFTMRLIAEERRNQTFALLLSAPLSDARIVLGKFTGLLAFLAVLAGGVMLMGYTLALGTVVDHGLLWSNLLGLLLLAASYVALGLYISALTAHPLIAAIGAFALLIGLWLADIGAVAESSPWHALSPLHHFQNFNNGLLDSGDAAFFVLVTLIFLALAIRRLYNNRRYG